MLRPRIHHRNYLPGVGAIQQEPRRPVPRFPVDLYERGGDCGGYRASHHLADIAVLLGFIRVDLVGVPAGVPDSLALRNHLGVPGEDAGAPGDRAAGAKAGAGIKRSMLRMPLGK